jgi:hypothetical protein
VGGWEDYSPHSPSITIISVVSQKEVSKMIERRKSSVWIALLFVMALVLSMMAVDVSHADVKKKSANYYAKDIKSSVGKFNREFTKKYYTYTIRLKHNQEKTKVTLYRAHKKAKIAVRIDGGKYTKYKSVNKISRNISVKQGKSRKIRFRIKAQNGLTKIYLVIIKRPYPPGEKRYTVHSYSGYTYDVDGEKRSEFMAGERVHIVSLSGYKDDNVYEWYAHDSHDLKNGAQVEMKFVDPNNKTWDTWIIMPEMHFLINRVKKE